ncbi:hypothetical protein BN14_11880 [Rhizoctonia solani AG-1 IB]|uniref:Uncharacterized protein n=1 Tax=Thanatephorus cucumeris (strain AG1-IB / isolate 7/3/14) TaxID=1108050 RepID=M5CE94_THACB|nr:hypothetical protein BN14_11880 [Rhizoctonia solani AG-1 IB]
MTHEHPANVSQEALTTSVPSATTICVEEDVTKGLRLKLENLKIQCDKYDSESSSEPGSPVPDTPACKGYIIESDLADQLLGERYYFVALVQLEQGPPEYCVFSLSPFHRMVSQVDKNSCFHHRYHAQLSEPVVNFRIGSKSPQLTRHNALLYVTLEEAKLCVDTFQWINLPAPGNLATPPLSRTGDSTPSPPSIAGVPPTVTGVNLPFISGYFGPSASQETIDRWVDYSVANDQATRDALDVHMHSRRIYTPIITLSTMWHLGFDRSKPMETYEEYPYMPRVSSRWAGGSHKGSQGNMHSGRNRANTKTQ